MNCLDNIRYMYMIDDLGVCILSDECELIESTIQSTKCIIGFIAIAFVAMGLFGYQ